MSRAPWSSILAAVLVATGSAAAQEAPAPAPCAAPEHRQFDFWIGTWDVEDAQGEPAGSNRIEAVHGGCALHESWQGKRLTGSSLSAWDPARGVWHQTWVDGSGLVLHLDGGFADGAMRLAGENPTWGREGMVRQEITWRAESADRVRQTGRLSEDGGATWTVLFDLLYVRRR
jgi:hypothetical protein